MSKCFGVISPCKNMRVRFELQSVRRFLHTNAMGQYEVLTHTWTSARALGIPNAPNDRIGASTPGDIKIMNLASHDIIPYREFRQTQPNTNDDTPLPWTVRSCGSSIIVVLDQSWPM
jgi:hypothetical protein